MKARVSFSNAGGELEAVMVDIGADYMSQALGDAVIELIRQSGGMLCVGDRIAIDEVTE